MMMRPCGKQHASPPLANLPATFDSTHTATSFVTMHNHPLPQKGKDFSFSQQINQ
jgi:hypothetical protein